VQDTIAMVLAGGSGAPLSVLAAERAVGALPFGGKYRVIDFVLSNCCHSGLVRVGLLTQHAPTSLHDHIGSGRPWDLDRRDARVLILQPYLTREHAGWYRGTADALALNWDVIEESRAGRVLVMPGDHVYKMDYRALAETHEQKGAAVTIAVAPVAAEDVRRFGMVRLGEGGRVTSLEEKPETTVSRTASMGVALFETEVLAEVLRARPVDLTLDVLRPLIAAGERVFAHEFTGYWEDVGTLGTYYRANLELLEHAPSLTLDDPRWPILTRDEERPPVLIRRGAHLERSLVANGCRVSGRVLDSILFPGVTVEAGAEVTSSIVFQDTEIEAGARVDHAILDKYGNVGAGAVVGDGDGHDGGGRSPLTLVGKYARIPEGARVGRGAVLGIGTHAGDFQDNRIASGARVPDHDELVARR
jgi:glucose-1-phosphate adenylyltransferase